MGGSRRKRRRGSLSRAQWPSFSYTFSRLVKGGSREGLLGSSHPLTYLKLQISNRFRTAKKAWHQDPTHHETEEVPPLLPKKSCLDSARNAIARTAAQIRTGHWRSAAYLKQIRKRRDDKRWFCNGTAKMSRSHVLHYC